MVNEYLRWEERYWNPNRGEWSKWWTNTSHVFDDMDHNPLDVTAALRKIREIPHLNDRAVEVREWSIEHVVNDLRGRRIVRSWRR